MITLNKRCFIFAVPFMMSLSGIWFSIVWCERQSPLFSSLIDGQFLFHMSGICFSIWCECQSPSPFSLMYASYFSCLESALAYGVSASLFFPEASSKHNSPISQSLCALSKHSSRVLITSSSTLPSRASKARSFSSQTEQLTKSSAFHLPVAINVTVALPSFSCNNHI